MPHHEIHLSDAELLMAADGELPARQTAAVRKHLDSCWTCRERMRSVEEAIVAFVRARDAELSSRIPPEAGPRALLRARLAETIAQENSAGRRPRSLVLRFATAAACLAVAGATLGIFQMSVNAEGPRPNSRVTPGETRPITLAEVCRNPDAEVVVRNISAEKRREVFLTYGVKAVPPGDFEVDYLITPDLGGADSVRNLWPQPYSARWNAKVKDKLEQRLHDLVCEGKIDLPTAQREIASDWIGAYKKYMVPSKN